MRDSPQKSPVEVTTIVGYDSILLDKVIRKKEQEISILILEIEERQARIDQLLAELKEFRRRIRYTNSKMKAKRVESNENSKRETVR